MVARNRDGNEVTKFILLLKYFCFPDSLSKGHDCLRETITLISTYCILIHQSLYYKKNV